MSSYSIQQQNVINQYRSTNDLGFALSDDAVVELMLKEMEKTGKVYPGFESLARAALGQKGDVVSENIFGTGFAAVHTNLFGIEKNSTSYAELTPTNTQAKAIQFLSSMLKEADLIVSERDNEAGDLSYFTNMLKEFSNSEYSRSNVKKQLSKTTEDVAMLEQAARGQANYVFMGKTVPVSFEEMFLQRRGVEFNEQLINDCVEKSKEFARVKTAFDAVTAVKRQLHSATVGNLKSQMSPAKSAASIIQAFKTCGAKSIDDINTTLADIEEKYKDNPVIQKYGGDFRLGKNSQDEYVIYRTAKNGYPAEATNEALQLIVNELSSRLDNSLANAIGLEAEGDTNPQELSAMIQAQVEKQKKDYEKSFELAYGKKELKALAESYVLKQQQSVANIEAALNIASMAMMILPGGAAATSGWLLKGATGVRTVKALQTVNTAAKAMQGVQQAISIPLMAQMTLRPTELWEQLSSENGMSQEEWKAWGQGVLQNTVYMAAGMGASKLAETGAAYYKTRALVSTLKQAGKSTDEISAIVKSNPVKFPAEIVQSLNKVDNLAKTLQVSTEVVLDLTSTIAVNKIMGNGDLLPQDVIMSIGFALSGGVLQKQFMPLTTDAKVKFLQDAFKDVALSRDDALNILKTMDDISSGRISVDDYVKKPTLDPDGQVNLIKKPEEELPMVEYGHHTPSEVARLRKLYSEYLSKEELDIFLKLSAEEQEEISHLMFGYGLSFENSRYHYALPEESKQKANLVLSYFSLEKIPNYQEFVERIQDFSEDEIYSCADIASWSKDCKDINVCLDVIKSCSKDSSKINLMKQIALLNYDKQSLFTPDDLLKIANSNADLSLIHNFFKEINTLYRSKYNLEKVEYENSSQLTEFACLLNKDNFSALSEACSYAMNKINIELLTEIASLMKDETSSQEIHRGICSFWNSTSHLKGFLADYKNNPKVTMALLGIGVYRDKTYSGFLEYTDDFTVEYISKISPRQSAEAILADHKQFLENIEKFPKETQDKLKELYLEKVYSSTELATVSGVDDPKSFEILYYSKTQAKEMLNALSHIKSDLPNVSTQELFDTIKSCYSLGVPHYQISYVLSPETYPVVVSMIKFNEKVANEVFTPDFLDEIARTIKDSAIEVEPDSIDKVLTLVYKSPEMMDEHPLVARLFSDKNAEFIKKLDLDFDSFEELSVNDFYSKSFEKYANEAEKFGCLSLTQLEEYLKTPSANRAEVGKLLGKIKKDALTSFEEKIPPKLRSLLLGETGTFTAKDFADTISKINQKPVLRAMLEVLMNSEQKVYNSVLHTISTMLLDTQIERSLWQRYGGENVKFRQEYATMQKIYTDALMPKIKEMADGMPEAEAKRLFADVQDFDFLSDFYAMLFSARRILDEGMLKAVVHNNSPAKMLAIMESLANVKDKEEVAIWKELFSAKGLKDNEVQQLLSMAGNIDVDTLKVFKEKFYVNEKLDVAGMIKDCFSLITSNAGINFHGEPDFSGWDLKYVPYILKAQTSLAGKDLTLLNNILESTFNGGYPEFLFNKSLPNGELNLKTKETFKAEGLDFDTWMNYDKVHKFSYTPHKQGDNIAVVLQSLENDIQLMLKHESLEPLVNKYLSQTDLRFEGNHLVNKDNQPPSAAELGVLVDELINFGKQHGRELRDAKLLELRDHFAARQKGLRRSSATGVTEDLTISLWKRDPKHDLFQGHYCGCCISLDGINNRAIIHSLSHVVDNTIELKNSSGDTIGKAKVLWMHDNKTGEPIFLVNGFEITGGKEYNNQVRDAFLEFFKDYSKAVAGKEVMIVTADCSYQKINIDDLDDYKSNINMLGSFPDNTYHLDTFQKQEGSWPKDLHEAKKLQTKIMYKPDGFSANLAQITRQLVEETSKLSDVLNKCGIKIEPDLFNNFPTMFKNLEILLDNVKILSSNIEKMDNPKDKEAEIQFALSALFNKDVFLKIRGVAENIHKDAAYIASDLTYEVTALFNDTESPISVQKDGSVYRAIYSKEGSDIGKVHGRPKSTDSVFSKIMNEIIDLQHKEVDSIAFNKAVRDAYGFRIISPDNPRKPVPVIIEEAAQTHKDVFKEANNSIGLEAALADFYKDGFNGSLWKQMTSDQQQSVLNIAIEHKSQPFVDRLITLISEGKISVEKISNYVTAFEDKVPYLTARQQMLIADAMSEKTGKPAVNYYQKPYSTRGSGYTAAQMNIKVWNYDTNVELQYRDAGIDSFAEKEHIPYDISENKITVRGKKYDSPRAVLNNLDVDGQTVYKKFRSDIYTYYRLKALGVENVSKPDISQMFAQAINDGKRVFKESPPDDLPSYLAILSEEGLESLVH